MTTKEIGESFRTEAKGPGPLWSGVARHIMWICEHYHRARAEAICRRNAERCKGMAISGSYLAAAEALADR
jgi:hypothetical protein